MRPMLSCAVFVLLCCTSSKQATEGAIASRTDLMTPVGPDAQDAGVDPRLLEAQASFEEARKLKTAGKFADATSRAEYALSLWEAVLGSTHVEVAKCLNLTGDLYRLQGDHARAESALQRGLAIRETALGKTHRDVANALNSLAVLYTVQGLYDRAEPLYERALAIREAALGKTHPGVADL